MFNHDISNYSDTADSLKRLDNKSSVNGNCDYEACSIAPCFHVECCQAHAEIYN